MANVSQEKLLEMFTMLLRLRRMEEKMIELSLGGMVPGFLHSYLGQEGVPVGVNCQLRRDDYIAATHRGRSHALAKGMDLGKYVAEVLCRKDGVCQGRAGEMHLADKEIGVAGCSGIVGGILSTALGLAFASVYKGEDRVAAVFFGDGASNQGTFHECLNLASVWKLPVIFVCENNGWAEFTPRTAIMAIENISQRAIGYNIPGVTVDGHDVLAVYDAAAEAIARARKGDGPTLLECKTLRWQGHYIGDDQKYRSPEDKEAATKSDAVEMLRAAVLERGVLTADSLGDIEASVAREIEAAVEFAKQSPFPDAGELTRFVYSEEVLC